MRSADSWNPVIVFVYYLITAGIAMFCMNPVIAALSLFGAVLQVLTRKEKGKPGFHLFCLCLFAFSSLINPLVYHNGKTVLFVLNDSPVTFESLAYGLTAGTVITSVLYWSRSFSALMTCDKLMNLFGAVSPKLALTVSMIMRTVPLFGMQTKKVRNSQEALGLYDDGSAVDSVRSGARIFSIVTTWALENGIVTADSMSARGCGIGRRSFYARYRFCPSDFAVLTVALVLSAFTMAGIFSGKLDFVFYPAMEAIKLTPLSVCAYSSYGLLVLLPAYAEIRENVRWKYFRSRI